jgi:hypothetical protein
MSERKTSKNLIDDEEVDDEDTKTKTDAIPVARIAYKLVDEKTTKNYSKFSLIPIILTVLASLLVAWLCVPDASNWL